MADSMDLQAMPEGMLVLHVPQMLSKDLHEQMQASLNAQLPGRAVLILHGGARLAALDDLKALERIEGKLDALLTALADEGEEEIRPGLTLDGEPAGQPRAEGQPL